MIAIYKFLIYLFGLWKSYDVSIWILWSAWAFASTILHIESCGGSSRFTVAASFSVNYLCFWDCSTA